jgi:23S rRNA (cytosine1962-C5)-methyltransferase
MNTTLSTVLLRPGEADRIVAGHPWIYTAAIHRLTGPVNDGDLVQVKDSRQRMLGVGFYNPRSKIQVRMLDVDRIEPNAAFFEGRIRAALDVRKRHMPGATSFRAVNAEGDLLSGLIVDKYEDVLVMQISSLGMEKRKMIIVEALKKVFSPRAIVERSDAAYRKFEGMEESSGVIFGKVDGPVDILLNGLKFQVEPAGGHKTGLYLDQQANYQKVADLVRGGNVLDCFSFLGGFALHAARAGANSVLAIDQSAEANAAAAKIAKANGLEDKCTFETVNAFDWLKNRTQTGHSDRLVSPFDMIVLDPPSFTRNRASVPDAMRGYKEIHIRALKLLKPGGTLATFCCSHHVDASMFMDVILAAAYDAHRLLRRVAIYSQSPDHPVLPSIPETEYLKGYAFEVVR